MHLGNIEFEENIESSKGGCKVTEQTEHSLSVVANLLSVDVDELRQAFITKVMMTNRGGLKGTVIMYEQLKYLLSICILIIVFKLQGTIKTI